MGWDIDYYFVFNNESQYDVYIIIDTNTQDGAISAGSLCYYCQHDDWMFVDNSRPWFNLIRDSAYIYVVDASKINLPHGQLYGQLTMQNQEKLKPEMILDIITIYNRDLQKGYTVYFSSE